MHCGKTSMFKLLFENKADINARNYDGKTPLHCAAFYNNIVAARSLMEADGQTICFKDSQGHTPASFASTKMMKDVFS